MDGKINDSLKLFIGRLEKWPEEDPPSPADFLALQREFRLTPDEKNKLELLANNHIRRAQAALGNGASELAVAELSRAAQLRPTDSRPRIELASIYLQRSLERGYAKKDRQKAVKLAQKALEINPQSIEARKFLQEYQRMDADFRNIKKRRRTMPIITAVLVIAAMFWWQKDWIFSFLQNPAPAVNHIPESPITLEAGESRPVDVDLTALNNKDIRTEFQRAYLGQRGDDTYLHILGRMEPGEENLGAIDLLIRGKDANNKTLFTLPWPIRDKNAPPLIFGDSQPLSSFRWLSESQEIVRRLEILPVRVEKLLLDNAREVDTPEIFWDSRPPEGAGLKAEIRSKKTLEAFDRQVLTLNLALENIGTKTFSYLKLNVSLGPEWPDFTHVAVDEQMPSMNRGERRVWGITMNFPLDANLPERPLSIKIADAGIL